MPTGLLLVAHGSRTGGSQEVVRTLAGQLAMLVGGLETHAAFLDHDEVDPSLGLEVLRSQGCTDAIVVPTLLTGAYHVFEDLPPRLGDALPSRISEHLGPDSRVITAVRDRLPRDATYDCVVLCAAGSSDPRVQAEVGAAAEQLQAVVGVPVHIAYLSAADPSLVAVLDSLLAAQRSPVVAPYLLAPGVFADHLRSICESHGVTHGEVIGAHPQIAALIAQRIHEVLEQ